jgi:hypothetical protein
MSAPHHDTIHDLLADPLIALVMRADKVERDDLLAMLEGVAENLAATPSSSYRYRNPRFAPPARRFREDRPASARPLGLEALRCGCL